MPEIGGGDLAVVLGTPARSQTLQRTLDALATQSVSGFEIVVVVDGADQGLPDLGRVRIATRKNTGPGAARNAGARSTDRPLVLFLGEDMIPAPRLVEYHLAVHNRHADPEVAVLGHVELHPTVERNRLNRWMERSGIQFDYRNIAKGEVCFDRFHSYNVSLKREFFLAAEGFDEDFIHSNEDTDCGWRLHQKGLRLEYEPDATVQHLHQLGWKHLIRHFQHFAHGERLMASKHEWFDPPILGRVGRVVHRRRVARIWPLVVDRVPRVLGPIRRVAETRADAWYYQQLGPYVLDAWEGARDLEELRDYLGPRYEQARLVDHAGEVQRELASVGDEDAFYRASEAYLYDLTIFALSGIKVPYLDELRRLVPGHARVLDWGCGIGSDGLRLLEGGYNVAFADFDNPSTRYLRWRLERRGINVDVYDIDHDEVPCGFDAAFALDVIEHVDDPFAFLSELERRAGLVMVNLLEDEPDESYPHRTLPIPAILDHAARRGIASYRRYHGRSHLVVYRGTGPKRTAIDRFRSRLQRRIGRSIPNYLSESSLPASGPSVVAAREYRAPRFA